MILDLGQTYHLYLIFLAKDINESPVTFDLANFGAMKWNVFLLLIGFLFFSSCDENGPPIPPRVVCGSSAILDADVFENGPEDDFDLDSVWINSNCLHISYKYGGGCGDTEMDVVGYHENSRQLPSSVHTRFSFSDKNSCEAYLTATKSFDLTPYQKKDYPQVILRIEGWNQPILYSY